MTSSKWHALGDKIHAAAERDVARGLPSHEPDDLADMIESYLEAWFRGEHRGDVRGLRDALSMSTMRVHAHEAWEMEAARRWLTPEARHLMLAELQQVGGREVAFILTLAADGRFGNPQVSVRGNATEARHIKQDIPTTGPVLLLHNHPTGDLAPSPADLQSLIFALDSNPALGDGIISPDAARLFMVRDPRPFPVEGPP